MNILVLHPVDSFFPAEVRAALEQTGNVTYLYKKDHADPWKALLETIPEMDVMITSWGVPHLTEEFYAAAKNLKIIAHTGGSVGDLANEALEKSGVILLSGNRFYAESVAQGTICYMLMGQRRLYPILKSTEETGWAKSCYTQGLERKTVGLLSFGMIAKNVARMLQVFGCKVQVYSGHKIPDEELETYHITQCGLEELFATSDIVSIHSGMTPKTFHMVNAHLLSLMKDNALIVNSARGAIIDEQALVAEVSTGRIRAVLDVFEVEPLPMDSGLRGLDNVQIVPHRAGPTLDVYPMVTFGLISDIVKYFKGDRKLENEISMEYAKNMTSHTLVANNRDSKKDK